MFLNHLIRSIACIAMLGFYLIAPAQVIPGKKDSVHSTALNQERILQVVMPQNYQPGGANKYDVIYVLDGDDNTGLTNSIAQFINAENFMPPTIIVGVLNIDRNKDLTPSRANGLNTSGGASAFLEFLRNELVPYINKNYPTSGDNILFGHSFGGLFVTYALLNDPNTFKYFLAADPSYWWDNNLMIKMMADKIAGLGNKERILFISGREGQGLKEMSILPMDTLLRNSAPAGFAWKMSAYPGETHGSVKLKSIYDGLRFIYDGYLQKPPEFHPMSGIVLKDKPIRIWFASDTSKVRYTIDGTVPTLNSPAMRTSLMMPGPGTFTAKIFTGRSKNDKVSVGVFEMKPAPAPVAKIKSYQPGGFHYAYYEGDWDKLPDFSQLKPVKEGLAGKDFDVSKMPLQSKYGLVVSGQVEIKDDGYYLFAISSDDGSKFSLGDRVLLNNDGLHNDNDFKSYVLPLKKGFYPVRIEYFQKGGGSSLRVFYFTPAMLTEVDPKPMGIPLELQYSQATP